MYTAEAGCEYAEQLKKLLTSAVSRKLAPDEMSISVVHRIADLHDIVDTIKNKYFLTDFEVYSMHRDLMPQISAEVIKKRVEVTQHGKQ